MQHNGSVATRKAAAGGEIRVKKEKERDGVAGYRSEQLQEGIGFRRDLFHLMLI